MVQIRRREVGGAAGIAEQQLWRLKGSVTISDQLLHRILIAGGNHPIPGDEQIEFAVAVHVRGEYASNPGGTGGGQCSRRALAEGSIAISEKRHDGGRLTNPALVATSVGEQNIQFPVIIKIAQHKTQR